MSAHRGFNIAMSWALMVTWPVLAAAQTRATDLPVAVGQKVEVTGADGRVTKGKVLRLTPASIYIAQGGAGAVSLTVADVRRIRLPDSVADGVVKGALGLGLAGLVFGAAAEAADAAGQVIGGAFAALFGAEIEPVRTPNYAAVGALVGVTAGALLGYAIDSSKMKTIYSDKSNGLTVSLRPIVSSAVKGVGVRVRW